MVLMRKEFMSGKSKKSARKHKQQEEEARWRGSKPALPDMEEELVAWIESLRAQNLRITRRIVQGKALELAQARETEDFHASDGWLRKFLKRHSFSLRRRTTVGQRLPQDLVGVAADAKETVKRDTATLTSEKRHGHSYLSRGVGCERSSNRRVA